jgi:hypothetical protein
MTDPEVVDPPIPLYQKILAASAAVLLLVAILAWHSRLGPDFWPLDASRVGPNLLASVVQWAIVVVAAAFIWPPTRRRIHRFVDAKTAPIHDKLSELHQHHKDTQAMIRHVIEHNPDIPNEVPGLGDVTKHGKPSA